MMKRSGCGRRLPPLGLLAVLVLCCRPWCPGAAGAGGAPATAPAQAPASAPATMPDVPDLGAATPKALVESMVKALPMTGKPHAWLGFQLPSNRDLARQELASAMRLAARSKEVADLVQARIGKSEADMVMSGFSRGVTAGGELMLRYKMAQIAPDGKINWGMVKIEESGDKATLTIAETTGSIVMAKVNGKWYLSEVDGQQAVAADAEGNAKMSRTSLKALDLLEEKVKSGQITKKNFIQEYTNVINSTFTPP